MQAQTQAKNGNDHKTTVSFKIERSLMGVANAYMQIAEDVVSGALGVNEAKEATRALNGVPAVVKAQLEAIKIFEKGSEKARQQASRILDLGSTPEPPKIAAS